MLSGSYREVRRTKAVSYLQAFMARSEMIRKPRTCPVFWVERTFSVHQQKTGNDPTLTLVTLPRKQKLGSESKVFGRKQFGRLT
jgi:hypothetical protein